MLWLVVDNVNDIDKTTAMTLPDSARSLLAHDGSETHLFREINRTYHALIAGFSKHVGTSASRLELMREIAGATRETGTMDLARRLGINVAAVTRLVKEMEDEKLVQRRPAPNDKRRSYLSLSSKGHKLLAQLHSKSHQLEAAWSRGVTPEELKITLGLLTHLRAHLEGES